MWLTDTSATHTYAAVGTYTAKLVRSIGNCYGLTGDEMRLCEIGNSNVLGTLTITITTTTTTTTTTSTGGAVTGAVECLNNSWAKFQIMARVTLADGSTRDFVFQGGEKIGIRSTQYADFATKPTAAAGYFPVFTTGDMSNPQWNPGVTTNTGNTSGSISFKAFRNEPGFQNLVHSLGDEVTCSVTWH
jgi:hypothetical protein